MGKQPGLRQIAHLTAKLLFNYLKKKAKFQEKLQFINLSLGQTPTFTLTAERDAELSS